ncbi:sporulation protein [Brevibacillus laterosporus]|uniref:YhcN/YlaJ family sporulation lipoprotein n=1 Tax=Brevibacillus laterosporus TaxID=1465 RepID=UPI000CE4405B|nr:YhcN/YlaJ family sporulation lipoprotein [Brevibacillus laterosporus]PPA85344.1 sporulation protein [Brevibacillus laterosporus]
MKKILYTASCLLLLTAVTACGTAPKQGTQTQSYRTSGYGTLGTGNHNGYGTFGTGNYHNGYGTFGTGNYNGYGTFGTGNYNGYGTFGTGNYNGYGGTYPYTGFYQSSDTRMRGYANNGQRYHGMSANHAHNRELADRITASAKKVKGVQSATTVVHGNEAVVGIELKDHKNSSHRRTIEREVNDVVAKAAPHHRVYVTSDSKMLSRVKSIDGNYRSNFSNTSTNMTTGPNTVTGNLSNVGSDFGALVTDLGRTITAPFR